MAVFFRILQIVARYGRSAVSWVWAHKGQILDWINAGQAVEWIVQKVRSAVGT
ncbi:aureocin A53 family class IId bacteriocin [Arcanobacterium phocae]|uniref:aureocin A53 family class IId bacteriocin n=1 Tax=Arcanobacterium phocae TaxID=131112 RepID=UPI001C0F185B|nr:aureocin A53 family class IId bacteriocin [Arcanobacterium phocae]